MPTRGVWRHGPQENLNSDPLRLLLTKFGTGLLFNTCDITIITTLNFKLSWGGGGGGGVEDCGWGSKIPCPPPHEALVFAVHEQAVIKISHALIPKEVSQLNWSKV